MAQDWSREEVAATVADYFQMLNKELRGESYSKREHNRRLQTLLNNRSAGAVEFKHANISAVLIEVGFPYIDGYKPRRNYQELLREEVVARLEHDVDLAEAARTAVDAPVPVLPSPSSIVGLFVPPPVREAASGAVYERPDPAPAAPRRINYLEREARNAALGLAGEAFVLDIEHRRLWEAGRRRLAERIEHVSKTQGDGLGYDIASFEEDGRQRLVEVKTTAFGSMTPFFSSSREVAVSETRSADFHLYRVFKFRESPRIFALQGSLRQNVILDAVSYRARLP
jgi:hypothetical protein